MTPDEVRAFGERGLLVRDGFAGREAALAMLERVRALPLRPAAVGRGRVDGVRGDRIAWLDDQGRFEALRRQLNDDLWLGLTRFELQAACYEKGAAYPRHRDAISRLELGGPSRRVTAIWYLNPEWSSGGELRLHLDGGPLEIAPMLDRLVVFLSEKLEHEVLPAAAQRWAVTAWYYGP
jgi:SM-20-related protein